jgi:hypothetical protein
MPFNSLEDGTVPRADPSTALEADTKSGFIAFATVNVGFVHPVHGVKIRQIANSLLEKFDPAGRLLLFL